MAAPTTTDELLVLIKKSGLLDPERLDACASLAVAEGHATAPVDLANALVRAGLLTQFHSEQFLLGKYRGFNIGKFKVMERLGSGGMGIVYLCEHQVMRHKVAIKVLPTSKNDNPAALGRFYREARAAGALEHPNLVRAHDIGQEGNLHYLVLDYVAGASLHQIAIRSGPLPAERAAHYIGQAALGLEHARKAFLVHRDIKPANILVERNGTVRVLDLGLARFYDDETDPLTLKYDEKNVLGTADYVAPEQALNSHDVDTRADIYSLGCTFYFLLAAQPPFPGGKATQKLIWHQVREPDPIRKLRPDVPEVLAAIVARMMAKDPADRYQTPGEVAAALEPWLREPAPGLTDDELPRLCAAATRSPSLNDINLPPVTPARGIAEPGSGSAPHATMGKNVEHGPTALKRPPRLRPAALHDMPTPSVLSSPVAADTDKTTPPPRPPRPPRPPQPPRSSNIHPKPSAAAPFFVPPEPIVKPFPVYAAERTQPGILLQAFRLVLILVLGIAITAGARWVAAKFNRPAWLKVVSMNTNHENRRVRNCE